MYPTKHQKIRQGSTGEKKKKDGLLLPNTPDLRHLIIASRDDTCVIGRPGKAIHDAGEIASFDLARLCIQQVDVCIASVDGDGTVIMGPACLSDRSASWWIVRVERGACAHLPDPGRLIGGSRYKTRAVGRPGERAYTIAVPLVDKLCMTTQRLPQADGRVLRARSNRLAIRRPREGLDRVRMVLVGGYDLPAWIFVDAHNTVASSNGQVTFAG